jgi:hypothetical protein
MIRENWISPVTLPAPRRPEISGQRRCLDEDLPRALLAGYGCLRLIGWFECSYLHTGWFPFSGNVPDERGKFFFCIFLTGKIFPVKKILAGQTTDICSLAPQIQNSQVPEQRDCD